MYSLRLDMHSCRNISHSSSGVGAGARGNNEYDNVQVSLVLGVPTFPFSFQIFFNHSLFLFY